MDYIYLAGGLILLTISGNYLVKAAVGIARYFRLSALVIGATVVSMGTSAPELLVSVDAALMGISDISLGNVIGSNIANLALVLGLTALILPIPILNSGIRFDWLFMMFASIFLWIFLSSKQEIGSIEGMIFIGLLLIYVIWSVKRGQKIKSTSNPNEPSQETIIACPNSLQGLFMMLRSNNPLPVPLSIVLLVFSSAGLMLGADILVKGASNLAQQFGVSERIIGLTVVAIGTSLPELATSLVAAFKKEMDISVGNLIGSNIFNILGILGITAIITPIPIADPKIFNDLIWMILISAVLILFLVPAVKRFKPISYFKNFKTFFLSSERTQLAYISRYEGLAYLFIYIAYILMIFF